LLALVRTSRYASSIEEVLDAVEDDEWIRLHGLPVTRPSRIAADLLAERDDPEAIAQLIADALRPVYDYPSAVAKAIAPYAGCFGLRRGDGLALLEWLLELSGNPERATWLISSQSRVESVR